MDLEVSSRKLLSFWLSLFFGCMILVGMERLGWSRVIWQVSEQITVPARSLIWRQYDAVQERFSWWRYWRSGQEELAKLRRIQVENSVLVAEVAELRKENQELRRLLGATFPADWRFLSSKILTWSGKEVVIDKGGEYGVRIGMMVVAAPDKDSNRGMLVGRVDRVHPKQAWIETVQDQDLILAVMVRDGETAQDIGEGLLNWNAGELQVDKLLPEDLVKVGDVVLTSGDEGFDIESGKGWLAGIPIGVVNKVSFERETDVYQKAKVSWLANVDQLEQVFVVTSW